MEHSLDAGTLSGLFVAMALLAAMPSVSVVTVLAGSAAYGFLHGAFTAMGIVLGDLFFIMLAVFGLLLVVEVLGEMFFVVNWLAAGCLFWFGLHYWRTRNEHSRIGKVTAGSLKSGFLTGLLVTLADQKAVLFYLGLLPAFLELDALSTTDIAAIAGVTIVAVGGVKLGYAWAADRAAWLVDAHIAMKAKIAAAGVMMAAGIYVLFLGWR